MDDVSAPARTTASVGPCARPGARPGVDGTRGAPGPPIDRASVAGIAFVLPSRPGGVATLSDRVRADGWRALAARVRAGRPSPLEIVDDLESAVSPAREVVVLQASAAAAEPRLVRRARAWSRVVLVTDSTDPGRTARLALELDARCVSPSSRARNTLVAELERHVPAWRALARTAVVHDAIPDGLGASRPPEGVRPLVTHWAAARDLGGILDAFASARARRPDLRLRVLVDPADAPPDGVALEPAPGVRTAEVRSPLDVVRELANSSGLYHPVEPWPSASIAAAALAGAVGAPAFVSARCAAAEAVLQKHELLASAAPEALFAALDAAADPTSGPTSSPGGVPVSFRATEVSLRWLEELSAAVRP